MLKRVLIPLSLLALAVILSGCIGGAPGVVTGTNGIIIKDFAFDYSPIYAEEQVGLSMEVQNVGGEEGTVQAITIFGADVASSCPGGGLQWCVASGSDPMEQTVSDDLLPPDPSTGMEGEENFYDWLLEAPLEVKAPTTYDFEIRLDYAYSTVYTGTLQLVQQDYLQTLAPADREALIKAGGVVDAFTTAGPLSLTAASGRHFIYRNGAPGPRDIKFRITNVGSGYPYDGDKTSGNLYTVRIPSGSVIGLTGCDTTETLSRGKTAVITCTFDPGTVTFTNKLERQFQITLEYEYYVDSAASITVNPVFD